MKKLVLSLISLALLAPSSRALSRDSVELSFMSKYLGSYSLQSPFTAGIRTQPTHCYLTLKSWQLPETRKPDASTPLIVGGALLFGAGLALSIAGAQEASRYKPNIGLVGFGKQTGGAVLVLGGSAMVIGGLVIARRSMRQAPPEE